MILGYRWQQLASPPFFLAWSERLLPWLSGIALLLLAVGLSIGLYFAPLDYQQGDAYRIMYIHVPAAFFSMSLYAVMAVSAAIYLIWHIKLSFLVARAAAEVGAVLTTVALLTGSLWGKPMWGTYWIWDARLTSELILLFLYLGFLLLFHALAHTRVAPKACSMLAIVGAIDLPIIHYSVYWWNTLHQGATVSAWQQGTIHPSMLAPLLIVLVGLAAYLAVCVCIRVQTFILKKM